MNKMCENRMANDFFVLCRFCVSHAIIKYVCEYKISIARYDVSPFLCPESSERNCYNNCCVSTIKFVQN